MGHTSARLPPRLGKCPSQLGRPRHHEGAGAEDGRTRPSDARRPVRRVLSAARPSHAGSGGTAIYLEPPASGTPRERPTRPAGSRPPRAAAKERDCLALHPAGFAWPRRSPDAPVGSYPTLSPITCDPGTPGPIGWSALCCTCRRPASRPDAPARRGARCPVVPGRSSPRTPPERRAERGGPADALRKIRAPSGEPQTASETSRKRSVSTRMRPSCSDTMMRSRWRISTCRWGGTR